MRSKPHRVEFSGSGENNLPIFCFCGSAVMLLQNRKDNILSERTTRTMYSSSSLSAVIGRRCMNDSLDVWLNVCVSSECPGAGACGWIPELGCSVGGGGGD